MLLSQEPNPHAFVLDEEGPLSIIPIQIFAQSRKSRIPSPYCFEIPNPGHQIPVRQIPDPEDHRHRQVIQGR